MPDPETIPARCTLDTSVRLSREEQLRALLTQAVRVEHRPTSRHLHFDWSQARQREIERWIAKERACCGFLHFDLTADESAGRLKVRIGGDDAAMAFVDEALHLDDTESSARGERMRRRAGFAALGASIMAVICCATPLVAWMGLAAYGAMLDSVAVLGLLLAIGFLWGAHRLRTANRRASVE